jgi:hypothetical protein
MKKQIVPLVQGTTGSTPSLTEINEGVSDHSARFGSAAHSPESRKNALPESRVHVFLRRRHVPSAPGRYRTF